MDAIIRLPPLPAGPQPSCPRADPMMERRTFLGTLGPIVLAAPFAAEAQQATKIARRGYLAPVLAADPHVHEAFRPQVVQRHFVEMLKKIVVDQKSR